MCENPSATASDMATVEVLTVFEEKNIQLEKLNRGGHELVTRPVHSASASASSPCELYFGGACRGNSGTAGIGFLLIDSNGEVIERFSSFLGYQFTINAAEFKALIAGLQHALDHGITAIKAYGDSDTVCRQVNGECMIKKEWLRRYCHEAWHLLNMFASHEVVHVRREENEAAVGLAKQGIDQLYIDTSPAAQDKVIHNCVTPQRAQVYVLDKRCEGVLQLGFILETIESALPKSYAAVQKLCSEIEHMHTSFPGSDDGSELNDAASDPEMEDWESFLPDPGHTRGRMSLYKESLHAYWGMKRLLAKAMEQVAVEMVELAQGFPTFKRELRNIQMTLIMQDRKMDKILQPKKME